MHGVDTNFRRLTANVLPRLHHSEVVVGCRAVNHSSRRLLRRTRSSTAILDLRRLLCATALISDTRTGRTLCGATTRGCPGSTQTCGGLTSLTVVSNSATATGSCLTGTVTISSDYTRTCTGGNLVRLVRNSTTTTRTSVTGTAALNSISCTRNILRLDGNGCTATTDLVGNGDGATTLTRVLGGSCSSTTAALSGAAPGSNVASCLRTVITTEESGGCTTGSCLGRTLRLSPSLDSCTRGSLRLSVIGWLNSCF